MASKPIATPLKTLDCCPVSDGGAAFILSRDRIGDPAVNCGRAHIADRQASGRGIVHAATLVARAPSPDLRALAPYLIVLIDAEERFRMMGHGDKSLRIGDAVVGRVVRFADRFLPYFELQRL
jgi:acetyl-CoA acetyltransferase